MKSITKAATPTGSPFLRAAVGQATRRSTHGPSPLLSDSKAAGPVTDDNSQLTPRGLKRKSVYLMSFDSPSSAEVPSKSRRSVLNEVKENMDTSDIFSPKGSKEATSSKQNRRRSSRYVLVHLYTCFFYIKLRSH